MVKALFTLKSQFDFPFRHHFDCPGSRGAISIGIHMDRNGIKTGTRQILTILPYCCFYFVAFGALKDKHSDRTSTLHHRCALFTQNLTLAGLLTILQYFSLKHKF